MSDLHNTWTHRFTILFVGAPQAGFKAGFHNGQCLVDLDHLVAMVLLMDNTLQTVLQCFCCSILLVLVYSIHAVFEWHTLRQYFVAAAISFLKQIQMPLQLSLLTCNRDLNTEPQNCEADMLTT